MGSVNNGPKVEPYKTEVKTPTTTPSAQATGASSTTPGSSTVNNGPGSDTFTPSNNLFMGTLEVDGKPKVAAGSTPAGSTPAGSTPAGSSPAGSSPAGSSPAGSTPAGSTPAGSTPAGSTPATGTTPIILDIDDGADHQYITSTIAAKFGPDAKVVNYSIPLGHSGGEAPPLAAGEVDDLIDQYSQVPSAAKDEIDKALAKNPDTKVINASFGMDRITMYDSIYSSIQQNKDMTPEQAQAFATKFGVDVKDINDIRSQYQTGTDPEAIAKSASSKNLQKGISSYVDKRMDEPNSAFNASVKDWQEYTKGLEDKGINVVVAAGNSNPKFGNNGTYNEYEGASPEKQVNFLAMSDHVISVGAVTDDSPEAQAAEFSSVYGGKWKPTLAADGTEINGLAGVNGTSFSAPEVSGTIGEMLAKNPNLKPSEIKKILTSTAYDTAPADTVDGAGTLNYDAAIAAAAGSTPAGSTPAGSTPAGSTPAGSSPAGSSPAGSTPAGSTPAGSTPTGSTPGSFDQGSTPAGSTPAGSTPAGSTPAGSSPAGSSPAGSSPAGSTPAGSSPAGSTPYGSTFGSPTLDKNTGDYLMKNFDRIAKGDGSVSSDDILEMMSDPMNNPEDWTYGTYLASVNPNLLKQLNGYDGNAKNGFTVNDLNGVYSGSTYGSTPAGSTPAGSTPAGSTPAGSSPAGSSPAGSTPAGSTPAGSTPTGSTPGSFDQGSTPAGSTPAGSTPAGSTPAGSSPAGSSPAGSSPAGSTPAGSTPAGSTPAGSSPAGSSPAGSTPAGSTPAGSTPAGASTYSLDQAFFNFGRDPNAPKDNNGKYLTTDFTGGYFTTTQGQADLGRIDALDGQSDGKIEKKFVTDLADPNSESFKAFKEYDLTKPSAKANKDILSDTDLFTKLNEKGVYNSDKDVDLRDIDKALKSSDFTTEEKLELQYLRDAKQGTGSTATTLWNAITGGNSFTNANGGALNIEKLPDLAKMNWDPETLTTGGAVTPGNANEFYSSLETFKDSTGKINYQDLLNDTTNPATAGLRNYPDALKKLTDLDKAEHGGNARGFIDAKTAEFLVQHGDDGYLTLANGAQQGFSTATTNLLQSYFPPTLELPETNTDGIYRVADVKKSLAKMLEDPNISLPQKRALEYLSNDGGLLGEWEKYVQEPGKGRTGSATDWQAWLKSLAPTGS